MSSNILNLLDDVQGKVLDLKNFATRLETIANLIAGPAPVALNTEAETAKDSHLVLNRLEVLNKDLYMLYDNLCATENRLLADIGLPQDGEQAR